MTFQFCCMCCTSRQWLGAVTIAALCTAATAERIVREVDHFASKGSTAAAIVLVCVPDPLPSFGKLPHKPSMGCSCLLPFRAPSSPVRLCITNDDSDVTWRSWSVHLPCLHAAAWKSTDMYFYVGRCHSLRVRDNVASGSGRSSAGTARC